MLPSDRCVSRIEAAPLNATHSYPLSAQRHVILSMLLGLSTAAWAALVWQGAVADTDMTMTSSTMAMRAPLFLVLWVTMMVAMMLPSATPMVLSFHRVQAYNQRQRGD